ncbi:MAG: asparagine synthase (glutamine-hydrolyzing), partial [Chlorobi bacterium]|nr:asparagine synthase (glutamine-hydrolyzing) [Chlorobiota bacterium]
MCGIAGIIKLDGTNAESSLIQVMARNLAHRGPDDEGYLFVNTQLRKSITAGGAATPPSVFDSKYPYSPKQHLSSIFSEKKPHDVVLAHRRLSIVDLSPAGHQPMCNKDMTIWIVHNGEIYNFLELRKELQGYGYQFVSDTDTEVIIRAYQRWGYNCLKKFNGMWAFCIWDERENKLFCSRDRFGIKPFYYYFKNNVFVFASEIKALLQLQFIPREPNHFAVYNYLVIHSSNLSKGTFFKGIEKLGNGEYLELDLSSRHLIVNRYWDIDLNSKAKGLFNKEYALKFYNLLEDSIRLRLISDVAIGTCLSGGIDSSSLVCIINTLLNKRSIRGFADGIQKTFSARYENKRFDEGLFINEIIKKTRVAPYYVFPTGK